MMAPTAVQAGPTVTLTADLATVRYAQARMRLLNSLSLCSCAVVTNVVPQGRTSLADGSEMWTFYNIYAQLESTAYGDKRCGAAFTSKARRATAPLGISACKLLDTNQTSVLTGSDALARNVPRRGDRIFGIAARNPNKTMARDTPYAFTTWFGFGTKMLTFMNKLPVTKDSKLTKKSVEDLRMSLSWHAGGRDDLFAILMLLVGRKTELFIAEQKKKKDDRVLDLSCEPMDLWWALAKQTEDPDLLADFEAAEKPEGYTPDEETMPVLGLSSMRSRRDTLVSIRACDTTGQYAAATRFDPDEVKHAGFLIDASMKELDAKANTNRSEHLLELQTELDVLRAENARLSVAVQQMEARLHSGEVSAATTGVTVGDGSGFGASGVSGVAAGVAARGFGLSIRAPTTGDVQWHPASPGFVATSPQYNPHTVLPSTAAVFGGTDVLP